MIGLAKSEFNLTKSLLNKLKKSLHTLPPNANAIIKDLVLAMEETLKGAKSYEDYLKIQEQED